MTEAENDHNHVDDDDHGFSFIQDNQIQEKLLEADDEIFAAEILKIHNRKNHRQSNRVVSDKNPVSADLISGSRSNNNHASVHKLLRESRTGPLCGWYSDPDVVYRKTPNNVSSKSKGTVNKEYSLSRDTRNKGNPSHNFIFRHYSEEESYIEQYRREHICLHSVSLSATKNDVCDSRKLFPCSQYSSPAIYLDINQHNTTLPFSQHEASIVQNIKQQYQTQNKPQLVPTAQYINKQEQHKQFMNANVRSCKKSHSLLSASEINTLLNVSEPFQAVDYSQKTRSANSVFAPEVSDITIKKSDALAMKLHASKNIPTQIVKLQGSALDFDIRDNLMSHKPDPGIGNQARVGDAIHSPAEHTANKESTGVKETSGSPKDQLESRCFLSKQDHKPTLSPVLITTRHKDDCWPQPLCIPDISQTEHVLQPKNFTNRKSEATNSRSGNGTTNSNRGSDATSSNRGSDATNSNRVIDATNSNRGNDATKSNRGSDATNSNRGSDATNSNRGSDATNSNRGGDATNSNRGNDATKSNRGSDATNRGSDATNRGSDATNRGSDATNSKRGSDATNRGSDATKSNRGSDATNRGSDATNRGSDATNSKRGSDATNSKRGSDATKSNRVIDATNSNRGNDATKSNRGSDATNRGSDATNSNRGSDATNSNRGSDSTNSSNDNGTSGSFFHQNTNEKLSCGSDKNAEQKLLWKGKSKSMMAVTNHDICKTGKFVYNHSAVAKKQDEKSLLSHNQRIRHLIHHSKLKCKTDSISNLSKLSSGRNVLEMNRIQISDPFIQAFPFNDHNRSTENCEQDTVSHGKEVNVNSKVDQNRNVIAESCGAMQESLFVGMVEGYDCFTSITKSNVGRNPFLYDCSRHEVNHPGLIDKSSLKQPQSGSHGLSIKCAQDAHEKIMGVASWENALERKDNAMQASKNKCYIHRLSKEVSEMVQFAVPELQYSKCPIVYRSQSMDL